MPVNSFAAIRPLKEGRLIHGAHGLIMAAVHAAWRRS